MPHSKLIINTDGGARGNPGPAGIGFLIRDPQNATLKKGKAFIGIATNNVAEYTALIHALKAAQALIPSPDSASLQIFMDSELIVRQLNGLYAVRAQDLLPLYKEVKSLLSGFASVTITHVRRSDNFQAQADRLVNEALDERFSHHNL